MYHTGMGTAYPHERRSMTEATVKTVKTVTVTKTEYDEVENYLRNYGFYKKLLRMDKYEQEYFNSGYTPLSDIRECPSEVTLAHAKMFEVRHFIMSMENSTEKLLLYNHYVKGCSVDRCAELLGISRSSAFRLKKRALVLAAEHYAQNRKKK